MTALECDARTDLFREQSSFVKKLEKMAQAYDVAIILVAHPKKSNTDFDNDTVSGSSDITNAVSYVWNYERGKDEESTGKIMVTKNRVAGRLLTGDNAIKVYYSGKSKRIQTSPYENKEYSCFKATQEELLNQAIQDLPF